ncbi:MAG: Rpn family recombination-promoting nuclease/putative transposase [Labilithrix sp.]|nr:Rpn family recombination-promoting nuclease/putative transposase [Labilithrix sp.]
MAGTPHDALFKWTFSAPERAVDELRSVLPAELSKHLRWETLRPEPGEFVDDELRGRHTDLLFSIRARGRRALLYLLFEHQSEPDALMPLRALVYQSRIWSEWLRRHPRATKVPPIVTVILHHGGRAWTGGTDLGAVFDAAPEVLAAAAPYLPELRLRVDDLSDQADEELRARAGSALVKLVLLVLKHGRDSVDIDARLARWTDLVVDVATAPHGVEAVTAIMRYLLEVSAHVTRERVTSVLRLGLKSTKKAEQVMATIGQQLIDQGFQQGIEMGAARGAIRGRRDLVLHLLRQRFGEVPAKTVARVDAANDAAVLDRWAERILRASTLAEVFDAAKPRRRKARL